MYHVQMRAFYINIRQCRVNGSYWIKEVFTERLQQPSAPQIRADKSHSRSIQFVCLFLAFLTWWNWYKCEVDTHTHTHTGVRILVLIEGKNKHKISKLISGRVECCILLLLVVFYMLGCVRNIFFCLKLFFKWHGLDKTCGVSDGWLVQSSLTPGDSMVLNPLCYFQVANVSHSTLLASRWRTEESWFTGQQFSSHSSRLSSAN